MCIVKGVFFIFGGVCFKIGFVGFILEICIFEGS